MLDHRCFQSRCCHAVGHLERPVNALLNDIRRHQTLARRHKAESFHFTALEIVTIGNDLDRGEKKTNDKEQGKVTITQ